MGHHHGHTHSQDTTANIRAAFFLNLAFTILEIIGGLWTNSLAILSDSLHDLGDSLSLGLSWYLERLSKKRGDQRFSYGYRRFSLLASLVNIIVLLVGGLFILSEAIPRLLNPEHTNARGMLVFALIGIGVNGLAALRVRGGKSLNAQMVAWHLLEDVLGWAAVLFVSLVLLFWDIHILDPILSILITVYVLWNVLRNLRRTTSLFLQGVPENLNVIEVEQRLQSMENVKSTHHTHIWSLDGEHNVLTTHVVVDACTSRDQVLQLKREINRMTQDLDLEHTTLEIEYEDEDCRMKD